MLTKRSGQAEPRKSPQFCCARIPVGRPRCEREFPSDKVYRGDERGIVGVESLGLQGLLRGDASIQRQQQSSPVEGLRMVAIDDTPDQDGD